MGFLKSVGKALGKAAGPIAAGVGAVADLVGSIHTNHTNKKLTRETNDLNYKMFQEQNAYNTEMWNAQNAYNDPSAARARYEAAGYNPYFALGNMDDSAGSVQSASPAPAEAPQVAPLPIGQAFNDFANNMLNLARVKNESDVAASEVAKNNAEAANFSATAQGTQFENNILAALHEKFGPLDIGLRRINLQDEISRGHHLDNEMKARDNLFQFETQGERKRQYIQDGLLKQANIAMSSQKVVSEALNTEMLKKQLEHLPVMQQHEIAESIAREFSSYALGRASLSQAASAAAVSAAQVLESHARTNNENDKHHWYQKTFKSEFAKTFAENAASIAKSASEASYYGSPFGKYVAPYLQSVFSGVGGPATLALGAFGFNKLGKYMKQPKFSVSVDGINFKKVR